MSATERDRRRGQPPLVRLQDSNLESEREPLVASWYQHGHYGSTTIGEEIRRTTVPGTLLFSTTEGVRAVPVEQVRAHGEVIAAGLRQAGLKPGDVVAMQMPTSEPSIALVAGTWLAGGIVLPIVDVYGRRELEHIVDQTGPRFLVVPSTWRGRSYAVEAVEWFHERIEAIVVVGGHAPAGSTALRDLERPGRRLPVAGSPDDVALVVYTSGTTSDAKGVKHSHNTLLANSLRSPGDNTSLPPHLGTFPAGHMAGVLAVLRPLLRGGTTVIMDRWSPGRAARLIAEHRVETSTGTSFYLATLLDEAERQGIDIGSLRQFLVGAAPVPPSLLDRAGSAGVLSWRTYGATEHPLVSAGGPEHSLLQRHMTDGRVMPGVEVRILDDGGNDLATGEVGDIVVRGPKQFIGYVDPDLNGDAFLPGFWFRTGDVGRLDAAGHLTVTDRRKDVIIRGGENISSKEVEDVLMGHEAVSEAAVCAAPDAHYGETVCAFVVLEAGADLDLEGVGAHFARAGVAPQKVPTRLELVEDLPRTPSGKVRKADLRVRLAASTPHR